MPEDKAMANTAEKAKGAVPATDANLPYALRTYGMWSYRSAPLIER